MEVYPIDFKAKIIAWHELKQLIEVNVQDAKNRKEEQLAKRNKGK
jgi:hypothetical protein